MNNREAMQEEFEAWVPTFRSNVSLRRFENGDYVSAVTENYFNVWQAALASQAQQPAQVKKEPVFDPNLFELTTIILSDCGISTNDQALYDRVLHRLIDVTAIQTRQPLPPAKCEPYGYVTTLRNGTKHFYESMPYLNNAVKCDTVYLQSQAQQEPAIAVELESVASQIEDGYGLWMTCSGCHETDDGHSVGNYKFSSIFNCTLGSGCHECGGLGAVWETFGNESPAPEGDKP